MVDAIELEVECDWGILTTWSHFIFAVVEAWQTTNWTRNPNAQTEPGLAQE